MNRKFEFKVQPEVLDLRVKIKGVRIHDIDNTVYSSSLNDYIDVHVKRLLKNLLKKQEFHKINPLVDLYNLISMDTKIHTEGIYSQKELIEQGKELVEKGDKSFIDAKINPEEMSIMLFTSGTTSKSKVVSFIT